MNINHTYRPLGDFIKRADKKNKNLKVQNPMGINIDKYFMPSVANIIGTDMTNYKLVSPNQFACNLMHVGRDGKIPVAQNKTQNDILVSPAYNVFEVIDTQKLYPDYLMLWFRRQEFDREASFYTDADVRCGLDFNTLLGMTLPVPSIDEQRRIVSEYETVQRRIGNNRQLINKLEDTAQTLYKKMFVDGIDKENLPEGWRMGRIAELFELQRGFDLPSQKRINGKHPIYASTGIAEYHNEFKVNAPGIVTGRSGSIGEVFYVDDDFWPLNTTLWVKNFKQSSPFFVFFKLKELELSILVSEKTIFSTQR